MTSSPRERSALQELLDAVDDGSTRLGDLVRERPLEGELFGVFDELDLDDTEVAVVLVALSFRLAGRSAVPGTELAARAATSSAGRLAILGCLQPTARLVRRGLMQVDPISESGLPIADTHYRLGLPVFERATRVFHAETDAGPRPDDLRGYLSNADLLGDLRRLSQIFRQRAARLFHLDPWVGAGLDSIDGTQELIDKSREAAVRVRQRIAKTTVQPPLACLALMTEHELSLDEVIILVTVLFQELIEGVGAVDAVDLVKLISENEAELVRRRHALRRLEQKDLLLLEGAYAGKDLTADASLPDSAIEKLLGSLGEIDSDEQLDFHAWLRELDSSDGFFDGLDGRL